MRIFITSLLLILGMTVAAQQDTTKNKIQLRAYAHGFSTLSDVSYFDAGVGIAFRLSNVIHFQANVSPWTWNLNAHGSLPISDNQKFKAFGEFGIVGLWGRKREGIGDCFAGLHKQMFCRLIGGLKYEILCNRLELRFGAEHNNLVAPFRGASNTGLAFTILGKL